jgi:hypothetical protein
MPTATASSTQWPGLGREGVVDVDLREEPERKWRTHPEQQGAMLEREVGARRQHEWEQQVPHDAGQKEG